MKKRNYLVLLLTILTTVGNSYSQVTTAVYDFQGLAVAPIHGQDNWEVKSSHSQVNNGGVCPPAPGTALDPDVTNTTTSGLYIGSQALQNTNWAFGGQHSIISRVNNTGWSTPSLVGAEYMVVEFDLDGNWWGKGFQLAFDNNGDNDFSVDCNNFDANEKSIGISTSQGNVRLHDASGNVAATDTRPAEWTRYRMFIDFGANGGQGSINVCYRELGNSGNWTPMGNMQGINPGFNTAATDQTNPLNLNGMFYEQEAGGTGYLDNVLVSSINYELNDTTVCNGQSVTLGQTLTGATYVWNTGATTATISTNQPGTYFVDVTLDDCITFREYVTVTHQNCCTNMVLVDTEDFEYGTNSPDVILGTIYHPAPQSHAVYSGSQSLYMNFVNNLAPGTLCYERFYTVCPGNTYELSVWLRETWGGQSDVTLNLVDGNGTVLATQTGIVNSGSWQNWVIGQAVPTTTTMSFQVISNWMPGSNDLSMDLIELSVCEIPPYDDGMIQGCGGGAAINLHDSISSLVGTSGTWTGPSNLTGGYLGTYDPLTMTAGTYTYTIDNGPNCPDSVVTMDVNLSAAPDITPIADLVTCGQFVFPSILGTNLTGSEQFYDAPGGTGNTYQPGDVISTGGTFYVYDGVIGCDDEESFTVTLGTGTVDLGNDTTICQGQSVTLDAGPGFGNYVWSDNSTNQTLTVTTTGTYYVDAINYGGDLVSNGDFELGNTAFSTAYTVGTGGAWGLISNPGTYAVTTSPNLAHSNFSNCPDHTTGTGNMMVVNGASTANQSVWCQTFNVTPNTDFEFSAWAMNLNPVNSASLAFSINGVQLGNPFAPINAGATCTWENFFEMWNSGASTTATICIVNLSTASGGNDFALDDISFTPICVYSDTIDVTVNPMPIVDLGPDSLICSGNGVTLDAQNPGLNYLWNDASTNQTLTVTTTGTYYVDVTDNIGCLGTDTVDISVGVIPTVDAGPDQTVCQGVMVSLSGSGANTYTWDNGVTDGVLFSAVNTATYTVTGTSLEGCTNTDQVVVNVNPNPTPVITGDLSYCVGETPILDAGPGYNIYNWSNGEVTQTAVNMTVLDNPITVAVTDVNGCSGTSAPVNLIENPLPIVDLGNDTSLCDGGLLTLDAQNGGSTYQWSDNSSQQNLFVVMTGTYWVNVTDINGCTSSDTIDVTFTPIPTVDAGPDLAICPGDSVTLAATGNGVVYIWDNNVQDGVAFAPTATNVYSVTVVDANNCSSTDNVVVVVEEQPVASFTYYPEDITLFDPEVEFTNTSINGVSYDWSFGEGGSSTEMNPTYVYSDTGSYVVQLIVTSPLGCTDTASVLLPVNDVPYLYVPNSFTPNNDGDNDVFKAVLAGRMPSKFEMLIFNRWGELIYNTENHNDSWNGTYQGIDCQQDAYIWLIRVTDATGVVTTEYRGHINLIR